MMKERKLLLVKSRSYIQTSKYSKYFTIMDSYCNWLVISQCKFSLFCFPFLLLRAVFIYHHHYFLEILSALSLTSFVHSCSFYVFLSFILIINSDSFDSFNCRSVLTQHELGYLPAKLKILFSEVYLIYILLF